HEKIHGNLRKNIRTLFVLYKREILQACLNSKRNLYNYLLKLGFRDEMKVGFVDLGWQGSTQSFFERLVAELFNASVTGYYFCYIGDKKFSKTRKSLLPVEKKDNGIVNQLYNNRRLAELLFSAPHGTIIAYGTSGKNGSTNVMPIEDWGAANFDVKLAAERLNSGALDSYSTVKNWLEISNIKISEYDLARLFCKQIADPPHAIKESTDWLGNLDSWSAAR
ncbi:MAG: hypothetical protein OEZ01_08695, partial [Candidatus Heimdallarchaeota archaeon]|nr:hypothetical protein [Candidatus Heimdallarchaeota archaeon]